MGMDVTGRAPKSREGGYFRANVWSWRPIHALIHIANVRNGNRLVPEKVMMYLGTNDGRGLEDQESCDKLAKAIEWLLGYPAAIREHGLEVGKDDEGEYIGLPVESSPLLCDREGHLYTEEDARKRKVALEDLCSAYRTSLPHVREFIAFLRNCGGFEVW